MRSGRCSNRKKACRGYVGEVERRVDKVCWFRASVMFSRYLRVAKTRLRESAVADKPGRLPDRSRR